MPKVRSRRFVIDASIARAAGDASQHPTSQQCRAALACVLDVCHKIVMTSALTAEWNKHQSGFARLWRRSMMARKKLVVLREDQLKNLESRLSRVIEDASVRAIVMKDGLLLEAALSADERILSIDDRVRNHLRTHITLLAELQSIHWANPCSQEERVVTWLQSGAPDDRSRQLGRESE